VCGETTFLADLLAVTAAVPFREQVTYRDASRDRCQNICVLEDEFVLLRNNGIRGQIEQEGAPSTLSQYSSVCLCVYLNLRNG